MIDVRIQSADFEPGHQIGRLEALGAGAVVSLAAAARADEKVTEMLVEHYPALAKNVLNRLAEEAQARWPLAGIILIHRHGRFAPGERLAFAAVAAADPDQAVAASSFLLEGLRTRAPFWRQETLADGTTRWR